MKIDILPAKLEVTRNEDNVVQSAVLKLGGPFARPFKYIAWNVALDDLAHLEPEEIKQGEWTKFTLEGGFLSSHKCSNCGFHGNQLWHFCPNCGASMRKKSPCDHCIDDSNCDRCDVPLKRRGEKE